MNVASPKRNTDRRNESIEPTNNNLINDLITTRMHAIEIQENEINEKFEKLENKLRSLFSNKHELLHTFQT